MKTPNPKNDISLPITGRPIVRLLNTIGDGAFLTECSSELAALSAAVHEHGGKGSITIKLEFKKADTSEEMVMIKPSVKTTVPKPGKLPIVMYTTEKGELTQHDPSQMELPGLDPEDDEEETSTTKAAA